MAPSTRLVGLYPALANPAFRLLWVGMLPATLAFQMGAVARPYAAFSITDSASVLGIVSLSTGLPMLVLALVGGVAADRFSRRRMLVATHTAFTVSACGIVAVSVWGTLEVWHLIVTGLIQGAALAFNMPTRQAYLADIVGRDLLPSAVALNSAGMNFCRLAGPSVAGILLALPESGISATFILMAVLYASVMFTLLKLPRSVAKPVRAGLPTGGRAQLAEGVRYVGSSPTLLALLSMAAVVGVLGMPYQTLMTVFAERTFEVGATGLGALVAATGLGALVGSVVIAASANVARPALLQLILGVSFGISLAAFGLAPSFPIAMVLVAIVGFFSASFNGLNSTLVVSNAAPRFYGRVISMYQLTFAAMPLGAVPLAWLADHIGAPATVALAGGTVAVAVLAVALLYPEYRNIGVGGRASPSPEPPIAEAEPAVESPGAAVASPVIAGPPLAGDRRGEIN